MAQVLFKFGPNLKQIKSERNPALEKELLEFFLTKWRSHCAHLHKFSLNIMVCQVFSSCFWNIKINFSVWDYSRNYNHKFSFPYYQMNLYLHSFSMLKSSFETTPNWHWKWNKFWLHNFIVQQRESDVSFWNWSKDV